MRVCLVCRALDTPRGGGIGAYYARFAPLVYAARHEVTVVSASRDGAERTAVRDGIRHVELPLVDGEDWSRPHPRIASPANEAIYAAMGPSGLFAEQVARVLPGLHREHRFEVVEAPETGAALWLVLTRDRDRWSGERAPRFVTHLFSPSRWIDQHNRAPAIGPWELNRRIVERETARVSDGLVCSSEHLRMWAVEHFGVDPGLIEVIPAPCAAEPGGAEPDDAEVGTDGDDGAATAGLRLLFVGRLEPRKGVDVLIDAANRVRAGGAPISLDLAGEDMTDPRTGKAFGRQCALRIAGKAPWVRFHGHVGEGDLAVLRAGADAGVAPGYVDNFPLACLEMMASRLPVIASDGGGTGELIRDGADGVLFAAGDPGSLAAAIDRFARLSASDRARLGRGARERIRGVCNPREVLARRLGHYESIARRPEARTGPGAVWAAPDAPRVSTEVLASAIGAECRRLPRPGEPTPPPKDERELRELLPYLVAARAREPKGGAGLARLRGLLRRPVRRRSP